MPYFCTMKQYINECFWCGLHCLSLYVFSYVCSGENVFLDSRFANFLGMKLSFWLSAYSVLTVVPLF